MKHTIFFSALLAALLTAPSLSATHNYSGEIVFRKTGPLTVEARIITFTNPASIQADRDTLLICWGDGVCEKVARSNGNGQGELIAPWIKRNVYIGTHTYASADIYTLYMTDPNRSTGILNVNPPASDNIPFHLQAKVNLLPDMAGSTESPVLLASPVDIGVIGQPFLHNPNAYSADGDSIAYELITPLQGLDENVPNYLFPNEIGAGANTITLDPLTGHLAWNTPQAPGLYVVAILVKFYRNGILAGTVMRDMLIEIEAAVASLPQLSLSVAEDVVLEAHVGETMQVQLTASSANPGQSLEISSSSGLYDLSASPAAFSANVAGNTGSADFIWTVDETHIREQPYTVVFKAKDDPSGLANIKLVRFKVVESVDAPLVHNPAQEWRLFPNPVTREFVLEWSKPTAKSIDIRIIDNFGRTLRSLEVPGSATRATAGISDFAPGVYFAKILSGGVLLETIRFVKQ